MLAAQYTHISPSCLFLQAVYKVLKVLLGGICKVKWDMNVGDPQLLQKLGLIDSRTFKNTFRDKIVASTNLQLGARDTYSHMPPDFYLLQSLEQGHLIKGCCVERRHNTELPTT